MQIYELQEPNAIISGEELSLNDYEEFCESTDVSNQSIQFYLDGMNEENGEISGVFKRVRRGDYGDKAKLEIEERGLFYIIKNYPDVFYDVIKEIGDRHWYTIRFLQKLDVTWRQIEQTNIDKLRDRVKRGKILGHGDDR